MDSRTNRIRQKTVAEQLLKEIRLIIAEGNYKYNDQIPTEQDLAERFNVSRSSVREAMKTLNYLGILESHTSRGTRITGKNRIAEEATAWSVILSYEDMREVFTLGTAIDTQVSIMIIENLSQRSDDYGEFIEIIETILDAMRIAAEKEDLEKYKEHFSEFFRELYCASENSVFISLNDCIDGLITDKVCNSYHISGNMLNAYEYFVMAWQAIKSLSILDSTLAFQQYGTFAFSAFTTGEEASTTPNL